MGKRRQAGQTEQELRPWAQRLEVNSAAVPAHLLNALLLHRARRQYECSVGAKNGAYEPRDKMPAQQEQKAGTAGKLAETGSGASPGALAQSQPPIWGAPPTSFSTWPYFSLRCARNVTTAAGGPLRCGPLLLSLLRLPSTCTSLSAMPTDAEARQGCRVLGRGGADDVTRSLYAALPTQI